MIRTFLFFLLWSVVLVLAQALVFNHICIMNVAIPIVFIYIIIRLPLTLGPKWTLTVAFLLGLAVDIFSDTYGMNSLSSVITAALRRPVLRAYFPREQDLSYPQPSIRALGAAPYIKFVLTITLIYCVILFLVESLTFFNPLRLVLRVVCSTILSSLILISIDSLSLRHREKRL
ncbi:MAG: rod shape-determining protein MreD [Paramuribaculum sp.]|nr:rod shape-determining protein MreD [Paramuribaculum sp.]